MDIAAMEIAYGCKFGIDPFRTFSFKEAVTYCKLHGWSKGQFIRKFGKASRYSVVELMYRIGY